MTETEVLDPADDSIEREAAACFGTWGEDYKECTTVCEVRTQCKAQTQAAPKPQSEPALELSKDEDDGLAGADPGEMLMTAMKGRYDVEEEDDGGVAVHRCRHEDGTLAVLIRVTVSGRYLIRTNKAVLQLEELESARQAVELVRAIMVV
jgi:hypothetical protein